MRILAAVLVLAAATASGHSAEIMKAGPGCTDKVFAERLFTLRDVDRDIRAFGVLLDHGLANGICKTFLIGQSVAIEEQGIVDLSCARPDGDPACFWMLPSMVK